MGPTDHNIAMSGNSNRIIAFNYFGGKFTWLDHLYGEFPSDLTHLVDLFGGSFAVSLNYRGRVIRTANEINEEVTNFFKVLRDRETELMERLLLTPCSVAEFDQCWERCKDEVERARRFYVRVRQSFFGLGIQKRSKGFHLAKTQVNCRGGETVSKWNNSLLKLGGVANAIRENFQITNYDYRICIDKLDFPKAFFYCDPPYPKECRRSYNDYAFEFSDDDHAELSYRLHGIQGMAMVSGYDCELMNILYKDWRKVKFPVKRNNIRSGRVQEVVWMNYDRPTVQQRMYFEY